MDKTVFLKEIDDLISTGEALMRKSKYDDLSDLKAVDVVAYVTEGVSTIHRISGQNSTHAKELERYISTINRGWHFSQIPFVIGTLKDLRRDVDGGYLISYQELIHADLFADFLDMAQYLLSEKYKDPAAVIIGGVLEEHIRKLCVKKSISLTITDSHGKVQPKKASTMNDDLAGVNAYSKTDHKNIIAWLDLRNKAAHAQYSEYTQRQIELFLNSVKDFISRNPA